jgi:iron-sulfur cluster insertion protein
MDIRAATQDTAPEVAPASEAPAVTISPSAAQRIAQLLAEDEHAGMSLRVSVSGGGCAGFQYGFNFDEARNADDRLFQRDGARVVIDEVSLELLKGGEIDYVEDLLGSYFKIANPNATTSCGCGSSFSV